MLNIFSHKANANQNNKTPFSIHWIAVTQREREKENNNVGKYVEKKIIYCRQECKVVHYAEGIFIVPQQVKCGIITRHQQRYI